jgi:hypothetical protein
VVPEPGAVEVVTDTVDAEVSGGAHQLLGVPLGELLAGSFDALGGFATEHATHRPQVHLSGERGGGGGGEGGAGVVEGHGVVEEEHRAVEGDPQVFERFEDLEGQTGGAEHVVAHLRPGEGERHTAVGQPHAHGHLAPPLVGPVAQSEEGTETGDGVEAVRVDGLVEVPLGPHLVGVLVSGLAADLHGPHRSGQRPAPPGLRGPAAVDRS